MPDLLLCQMGLSHDSGLPRDVAINTFHFLADALVPTPIPDLSDAVTDFYQAIISSNTLTAFLSENLSGAFTQKWYVMSAPPPRVPALIVPGVLTGLGSTAMVEEAACCLSYQGEPTSGEIAARRRGRIFFGPLSNEAVASTVDPRPKSTLVTRLCEGAQALVTASAAADAPWVVYSRVNDDTTVISEGWVDNAFDTQRRRGPRATLRTVWPI